MSNFSYEIKIPKDRIAVLIGKKGELKKQIETETKTKIDIDSQEGDVVVSGEDAVLLFATRELIKAIARGFNPDVAMQLLKQDMVFELLDISEFARSKKDTIRLKGRVIGNDGKSRRVIEGLTDCNICVYGKTIGLIGKVEWVPIAKKAIESLLAGSPHSSVYTWLERKRRDTKREDLNINDMKDFVKEEYFKDLEDIKKL